MPPKRFSCNVCGVKCLGKAKHEEHLKMHLNTEEVEGKGREEKPAKRKNTIHAPDENPNGDSFRAQMRGKLTKVHSLLDTNSSPEKSNSQLLTANVLSTLKEAIQAKNLDSSLTEIDSDASDIKKLALSLKNSMNNVKSSSAKTIGKGAKAKSNTNSPMNAALANAKAKSNNKKLVVSRITRRLRSLPETDAEPEKIVSQNLTSRLSKNVTKKVHETSKGEKLSGEVNQSSKGRSRKRNLLTSPTVHVTSTKKGKTMKVSSVLHKDNSAVSSPEKGTKGRRNVMKRKKQKISKSLNQTSISANDESFLYKILSNATEDECSESVSTNEPEESQSTDSHPNSQDSEIALPNDTEDEDKDTSDELMSSKKFSCALCSKVFTRKYHLDRHLKLSPCSGLPPQSFSCHLCNRVYTRKDNLREHLRAHAGELQRKKKHVCQFCGKAYHGQSLLTIHIRKHTGEKPFPCDFCSNKFPSAGALVKHRRTHTGEKPFSCVDCGQRFSLKGTLNRHMKVHTGIRPHKCMYCGKQFIQIGGLKAHLFYHTGENGFKCDECGKIFNRKARLQMHKLYVHVKHRPFGCEHCNKSFTRKEDLARHSVLHTGEKPFKCQTCNKSFAIKQSLKLHLLTHTKEEPRSCHECGRAFIRKDCLLRHMRKRHRDLLDKILVDENGENIVNSLMRSEEDLCENIQELLSLLVDEPTLSGFGWPDKPVDEVLEAVIRRCGHMPVSPDEYDYISRMRENAKLLFTVVIDDSAVKTLLNNQTVDEVILHVLRLAKT